MGVKNLERDRPVVLDVVGEVDGSHAPSAELTLEMVAAGEPGPELAVEIGQFESPAREAVC